LKNRVYIIYSSLLEQSVYLRGLLNKYTHSCEIITSKNGEKINLEGTHIPTGATSTEKMLIKGDVTLGNITMTTLSQRVFDKNWLLQQAQIAGIRVPQTWQCIDEITEYPIFYKQKHEKGGGERGIALNQQEIPKAEIDSLIFQELILSKGTYGVGFLAEKGKMLTFHAHFETESLPKEGGSAVIIKAIDDKRLIDYTKKLLESINYSGWGLAEYKYCPKKKDFVLMEINAKFWASCELAFVNQKEFSKQLFNIDISEKPIQKMVFVDRAIQRGFVFFIKEVIFSSRKTTLRLYSGWGTRLIVSIMPTYLYAKIKSLIKRH
jgi:hypothetical protein